jgi:hypothetical protein
MKSQPGTSGAPFGKGNQIGIRLVTPKDRGLDAIEVQVDRDDYARWKSHRPSRIDPTRFSGQVNPAGRRKEALLTPLRKDAEEIESRTASGVIKYFDVKAGLAFTRWNGACGYSSPEAVRTVLSDRSHVLCAREDG